MKANQIASAFLRKIQGFYQVFTRKSSASGASPQERMMQRDRCAPTASDSREVVTGRGLLRAGSSPAGRAATKNAGRPAFL
jgi:hypothetical protein